MGAVATADCKAIILEFQWIRVNNRKEKEMKMNAGWFAVKKANEQVDPLSVLPSFKKYQKNDLNLTLETKKIDQMDLKTKEWVIDLMERNMREIYAKSEHGWDEEGKLNELMDNAAWYLIAKDADTEVPVAYSHFRYDMEDGDDVLFCYEILSRYNLMEKKKRDADADTVAATASLVERKGG